MERRKGERKMESGIEESRMEGIGEEMGREMRVRKGSRRGLEGREAME